MNVIDRLFIFSKISILTHFFYNHIDNQTCYDKYYNFHAQIRNKLYLNWLVLVTIFSILHVYLTEWNIVPYVYLFSYSYRDFCKFFLFFMRAFCSGVLDCSWRFSLALDIASKRSCERLFLVLGCVFIGLVRR